jgi:hypothetical protein
MPKLETMDKIVKFVNIMIILLFLFIDSSYSMQIGGGKPFYILFKFPSLLLMQYLSHFNNIFFLFTLQLLNHVKLIVIVHLPPPTSANLLEELGVVKVFV